jgi:hypothetical protein
VVKDQPADYILQVNTEILPAYFKAKVEADEHIVALAYERNKTDPSFQAINLRPGTLSDEPPTGKIHIGRTSSRGKVSRSISCPLFPSLTQADKP